MLKPFIYTILGFSIFILIGATILTAVVINREEPKVIVEGKALHNFCGTPIIPDEAVVGKQLFNIHCAACHRINSKGDYTAGFRRKYPSDFAMACINAEDSLISIKVKDEIVIKLNREHEGSNYTHEHNFTKSELNSIFAYIVICTMINYGKEANIL